MKELSNREISKIFEEIGEMLDIIGEEKDQFRIIAYQNAARYIEMMSREVSDIYNNEGFEGLLKIKGVGSSIAEKIEEIIKTGKCQYHNELSKKVAPSILKFLTIPGVGPHLAKNLFENYKTKNIHDLKNALKKDKTGKVFKEKTRQNILEGIELLSKQTGRMLLSFAEPIAQEIVESLKKISEVKEAHPVGSLRRMKETIGDIDIIASLKINSKDKGASDKQKVIDKFIQLPFVERIIAQGDTKATIIHKKGPSVDLEILPSDEYGSLLQHFTGSKEHNVVLRTYAEKHGFSVSEHGIKQLHYKFQDARNKSQIISNPQIIKCEKEEKVYKTLGMDWIPPEIRENKGEIEAALRQAQGKSSGLPKLVKLKDIKGDLHLHSTWSEGEMTISEIVEYSQKLGYEYIAITDHTAGLGITHGLKEKDIDKYIEEIKSISDPMTALGTSRLSSIATSNVNRFSHDCAQDKSVNLTVLDSEAQAKGVGGLKTNIVTKNVRRTTNNGIKLFAGVEVNILVDGSLDISDRELSKLDIVIASIHSSFRQSQEQVTARLLKAIQNPNVDIIGHPSGRLLPNRQPLNLNWKKIFEAARKYNVAMEINSHPTRLDLTDDLCFMARDMGVKFIISSDMHHAEHFQNIRYGVSVARRGWCESKNILNTLDYNGIKKVINIH